MFQNSQYNFKMHNWRAISNNKPSNRNTTEQKPTVILTNTHLSQNYEFGPMEDQMNSVLKDFQLPHYVVPVLYVPKRIVTKEEFRDTPYHEVNSSKFPQAKTAQPNTATLSESESKLYTMLTKKLYGIQIPAADYGDYIKYKSSAMNPEKNPAKETPIKRPKRNRNRPKGTVADVIQKYNNPDYHSDSDTPVPTSSNPVTELIPHIKRLKTKFKKPKMSEEQIIYETEFVTETDKDVNDELTKIPIATQTIKTPKKAVREKTPKQKKQVEDDKKEPSELPPVPFTDPPQLDYLMSPKLRTHSANGSRNNN